MRMIIEYENPVDSCQSEAYVPFSAPSILGRYTIDQTPRRNTPSPSLIITYENALALFISLFTSFPRHQGRQNNSDQHKIRGTLTSPPSIPHQLLTRLPILNRMLNIKPPFPRLTSLQVRDTKQIDIVR